MTKSTTRSVFFSGELFSVKHLIGNAVLAREIEKISMGQFRCVLAQDFLAAGARNGREIRNRNLRVLLECDLALFNFDGPELDSGTVVEFMFAKFADIPAVVLRTDSRNTPEPTGEPWNLMVYHFPRTVTVLREGLDGYLRTRSRSFGPSQTASATTLDRRVITAERLCEDVARRCVSAIRRVSAQRPVLTPRERTRLLRTVARTAGFSIRARDRRRPVA